MAPKQSATFKAKKAVKAKKMSEGTVLEKQASPSHMVKSWAHEVLQVLDKPNVAVCIFIFGVIIIVVASKQLKMTFDLIENYWGGKRPQDGFFGNFMVIFVFLYVWLDTVILQGLKTLVLKCHGVIYRRYCQILEALEKIQEDDEYEFLKQKRMQRQRKASREGKAGDGVDDFDDR